MTIAKDTTAVPQTSLLALAYNQPAVVWGVQAVSLHDPIARRLRELGFVPGEPVRVVAKGPVGADPLLIQIGFTRFALRRAEAARVLVEVTP
jgi:ferrous iron transport protein A